MTSIPEIPELCRGQYGWHVSLFAALDGDLPQFFNPIPGYEDILSVATAAPDGMSCVGRLKQLINDDGSLSEGPHVSIIGVQFSPPITGSPMARISVRPDPENGWIPREHLECDNLNSWQMERLIAGWRAAFAPPGPVKLHGGKRSKWSDEERHDLVMRARGLKEGRTWEQVGSLLGIPGSTLYDWHTKDQKLD